MTASLTAEQQAPFCNASRHACIFAAAGSGKTRTLAHMLVVDILRGVPPNSIVAFTFTEKAAAELLARVHMLCRTHTPGVALNGLYIGTIHSWCLQYLREHNKYYNFDALDELQLDALVSRLYDFLGLGTAYQLTFPRAVVPFLKDLEVFYNEQLPLGSVPAVVRPCIERLLDVLTSNRLLTFGGMIRNAVDHLTAAGPPQSLTRLYVDEYQDVNPAQVALIKAMLPPEGRLIAVGDDMQCIYNWRGSDVSRILRFSEDFLDSTIFRLGTNYRSRPSIIVAANAVASRVVERDAARDMAAARPEGVGNSVWSISTSNDDSHADAIARVVRGFVDGGVLPSQIAVLLRSVRSAGSPIVSALEQYGMPVSCPALGGGGDFTTSFLLPVLTWLTEEKIEPKNSQAEAALEARATALERSATRWLRAARTLDDFWGALNVWGELVEKGKNDAYNVRGCLYRFLDACGPRLSPYDAALSVEIGIASQVIRSVEEVHRRRLVGQVRRTPRGVLREVIMAIHRYGDRFGESAPVDGLSDGVTVTTVHQAKGREWAVVIVGMLANQRFPVNRSPHGTSYSDAIAARYGTTIEDERRLFYVAITRARERLVLVDPCERKPSKRSVFIADVVAAGKVQTGLSPELRDSLFDIGPEGREVIEPPPLRVGLSDLLLYLECPFQFGLRRVVAVQPAVSDELGFGRGLHELIQRRIEAGSPWSPVQLGEEAHTHVHLPLASESMERQSRAAIIARIALLDSLKAFNSTFETELEIDVAFTNGIVDGVIDLVDIQADGSVRIRDWKSNIHEELADRYRKQLQFYSFALSQLGRNVSGADMVDVGASSRSDKLVSVAVPIDSTTVAQLVAQVNAALSGIQARSFSAAPTPAVCAACDMNRLCAHRLPINV